MVRIDSGNFKPITPTSKKISDIEKDSDIKTPRELNASSKDDDSSVSRNRGRDSCLMKLNSGLHLESTDGKEVATRTSSSGSGFLSTKLHQKSYASKCSTRELVESCCICCDDFNEDTIVVCLPCMHLYHVSCLKDWVNTRLDSNMDYMQDNLQHPDCPSCRKKLTIKKNQAGEVEL